MSPAQSAPPWHRMRQGRCLKTLIFYLLFWALAHIQTAQAAPFFIVPAIEGLWACEAGWQHARGLRAVQDYCAGHGLDNGQAAAALLDRLEPGGPKGQVQVGMLITVQMLGLYTQDAPGKPWRIDARKLDALTRLVTQVRRPFVLYLSASHFDSQGPLAEGLLQDRNNLMLLANGSPPENAYFGYRIAPWTLRNTQELSINFYRFEAVRAVAQRVRQWPKAVQDRLIAVTLPGELHHLFPNFESGMGRYDAVAVTDYHPASVAEFRQWLLRRHGSLAGIAQALGLRVARLDDIPAPGSAQARQPWVHYDAHAAGTLPVAGWLWDPKRRVQNLHLLLDGQDLGPITVGFNRLDVYRALPEVDDPNVGFRRDLRFDTLAPGDHEIQVLAHSDNQTYLLGQVAFTVEAAVGAAPQSTLARRAPSRNHRALTELADVKASLDLPAPGLRVRYNPLARAWDEFRAEQARSLMQTFFDVARSGGLPPEKIYSHQILPEVNSSWNPQLFAVPPARGDAPWRLGINLYGGATDSKLLRQRAQQDRWTDYGVPEFNPQQWKRPDTHLRALQAQRDAGARFVSPYFLSLIPDPQRGGPQNAVNAMEIRPDNPKDGSDQFWRALQTFSAQ
ncbi:MAG: hypothetical protein OHK0048_03890 [Rhodoferax sp.]